MWKLRRFISSELFLNIPFLICESCAQDSKEIFSWAKNSQIGFWSIHWIRLLHSRNTILLHKHPSALQGRKGCVKNRWSEFCYAYPLQLSSIEVSWSPQSPGKWKTRLYHGEEHPRSPSIFRNSQTQIHCATFYLLFHFHRRKGLTKAAEHAFMQRLLGCTHRHTKAQVLHGNRTLSPSLLTLHHLRQGFS